MKCMYDGCDTKIADEFGTYRVGVEQPYALFRLLPDYKKVWVDVCLRHWDKVFNENQALTKQYHGKPYVEGK